MVGFAINIVAFLIVGTFLFFLAMGALALIGAMFGSSDSSGNNSIDNKAKGKLGPVLRILGLNEGETIRSDTPKEVLNEAIEVYRELLKETFDSETPEQRKGIYTSDSPSGKLLNAFFAISGLGNSLNILTKDINYVMEGSGWVGHKNLLKTAIGGTLKVEKDKYKIIFNKDFYLSLEEYSGYGDSYDQEKEWNVEGYYNNKEVLSCYAPRTNNVAYTFKPGVWILDVLRSAEEYSTLLEEYELNQATERRESQLFD